MASLTVIWGAENSLLSVASTTANAYIGTGTAIIPLALICLLAYFNLIEPADITVTDLEHTLGAIIISLFITFVGIVIATSLKVV